MKITPIVYSVQFVLLLAFFANATAQGTAEHAGILQSNLSAVSNHPGLSVADNSMTNRSAALFDIQQTYNLDSSISQLSSFAACAWIGNEWWVSQWNKDSLYTLSASGAVTAAFRITGVGTSSSGVRSITTDGTLLYMADNTTSIKVVDPVTKTLVTTISTAAVPFNGRAITYDPTADGGAGGFWMSNFNTSIAQIDMYGNLLGGIPVTTHTLAGIYGLAFDIISTGGPYLWAFDQTSTGTAANLVRLQLPSGAPTFVVRNVNLDLGPATGGNTGLAGGLFITTDFFTGQNTIAGVLQGTPDDILFALELNDATQLALDASLDTMRWTPGFTIIPDQQLSPIAFPVIGVNRGGNTIAALNCVIDVFQGTTSIFNTSGTVSNISSGATFNVLPSGTWLPPGIGTYRIAAQSSITGAADQNTANDTISFRLNVSDTVFARDNGFASGALGIGDSIGGTLGQLFTFTQADIITSVTFRTNSPTAGDFTRAVVYDFNGTVPVNVIGESDTYTFTPADTDGVVLTFEVKDLSGNPLAFAPGTYLIGVEENFENVSLGTSTVNWRPGTAFATFNNQPWAPIENFGFKRVFVLRVNTGNSLTSVAENIVVKDQLSLFPNPSDELIYFDAGEELLRFEITDLTGRTIMMQSMNAGEFHYTGNIATLPSGVYHLRALGRSGNWYGQRLIKP
jgi:hypothetical protein